MNQEVRGKCMRLLSQAKRGDEHSHRLLVESVSREYKGMVAQFYTSDPMLGREDIAQEFYWGIWRAVEKVDHRGDPVFHLAQRGQWAVKSVVAAVNKRRHGTAAKEGGITVVSLDADTYAWREPSEEAFEEQVCEVIEIAERRREARARVHRLYGADLRPSHIVALEIINKHNIDLSELGARRRLARLMPGKDGKQGISGQRISVIMKQIEDIAARVAQVEGVAA